MADFNNTVSISYRADIKDLLAQLKKMPHISEEEARKMVKGIDRQFKQMEKSYQRAAKNSQGSLNRVIKSQKAATLSARSLRKEAANLDRLTGELSVGLGLVSDDAAILAQTASAAASGAEGLARAMLAINPVGLTLIGTITALGGAYLLFSHNTDKLDEATQKFQSTLQNNSKELERLQDTANKASRSFGSVTASTNNLRNELMVLRGEIEEVDLSQIGIEQQVFDTVKKLTAERDKQVEALLLQRGTLLDTEKAIKRQRDALEDQKNALFGVGVEQEAITATNLRLIDTIQQREAIEKEIRSTIKKTNISISDQAKETRSLLEEKIKIEESERRSKDMSKRRKEELRSFIKHVKQEQKELQQLSKLQADSLSALSKVQGEIEQIETRRVNDELKLLDTQIKTLKAQGDFLKNGEIRSSLLKKVEIKEHEILKNYHKQNEELKHQKEVNLERSIKAQEIIDNATKEYNRLKDIAKSKEQLAELSKLELTLQKAKEEAQKIEYQNLQQLESLEENQILKKEEMERNLHGLKMEYITAEKEANRAALEETLKGANFVFGQFNSLATAVANANLQLQQNNLKAIEANRDQALKEIEDLEQRGIISETEASKRREENEIQYAEIVQKKQLEIFNTQQQAARSKIIMDAAVATARAFADLPLPAALLTSTIAGASALAQLKAVNSAPPPQFDIGGMIGSRDPMAPDQRTARVLEGEAILDRSTVQRIGGEQGIRQLQRSGSSGAEVVVIQPFKHFDRFINSANKRGAFGNLKTGKGAY